MSMSKDEYRKAFKDSGLKASSWCKFLDISQYQHRNYQNGRTVVPARVEELLRNVYLVYGA